MNLITADFILTCNDNFEIIKDGALVFEKEILEIGEKQTLLEKYPNAKRIDSPKNSVLLPGLINPHVHLEFSANTTTLHYGDFISWLNSVIGLRDDLLEKCNDALILDTLQAMLQTGTTSLGAISSFGKDLQACKKTPQRVVFFCEILGSRPDSVDILFEDFKSKLRHAQELEDERFFAAVSIHSPYSTHPILAKNALDIARKENYVVSTHFMESVAEREWLDSAKGDFYNFFSNFAPNARPLSSPMEYIELFANTHVLFTHCVQAKDEELKAISNMGGHITHCPVSNRLLGVGKLELKNLPNKEIFTLATDGLSSNISLNLWDEMRAFLFTHPKESLQSLAKLALQGVTKNAAKALKLECGVLSEGKNADFLLCTLPDKVATSEDVALQLILHVKTPEQIYIAGEKI